MSSGQDLPIVQVADQQAWRAWLEANHAVPAGVWLKFAKKGSPTPAVTYPEAVEEAICFGWIDGQARSHDEHFYLQRFSRGAPRAGGRRSTVRRRRACSRKAGSSRRD
jgi:uncharacterized protein YdeI (YjbR/CyaY-like superfamily)